MGEGNAAGLRGFYSSKFGFPFIMAKVAGQKISTPSELIALIGNQGVGNVVTITFLRNKIVMTKDIKLTARPDDVALLRKHVEGKPFPNVQLENMNSSSPTSFAAYKGMVVLVEFWATWCPACKATHPRLSAFAKSAAGPNIVVVGISNEAKNDISNYTKNSNLTFEILRDPEEKLHTELKVSAIPMILVLDKEGVVRFATIGGGHYLEEAIQKATELAAEKKTK